MALQWERVLNPGLQQKGISLGLEGVNRAIPCNDGLGSLKEIHEKVSLWESGLNRRSPAMMALGRNNISGLYIKCFGGGGVHA